MKLRLLAGAVALVVAGSANAAIDNSYHDGQSGNGELFFSIWDSTNQTSYTADLGVKLTDFAATPSFASTNMSGLGNYISNADQAALSWNVAALAEFNAAGDNLATYGVMSTSNDPLALIQANNDISEGGVAVVNSLSNGENYVAAVNGYDHDVALNNAVTKVLAVDGDNAYAGGSLWGNNFGGIMGFSNAAALGDTLGFYYLHTDENFSANYTDKLGGETAVWTLNASGDLAFGPAAGGPAPVPLPPALWLLGSAMVGLVGVARRRKASV